TSAHSSLSHHQASIVMASARLSTKPGRMVFRTYRYRFQRRSQQSIPALRHTRRGRSLLSARYLITPQRPSRSYALVRSTDLLPDFHGSGGSLNASSTVARSCRLLIGVRAVSTRPPSPTLPH